MANPFSNIRMNLLGDPEDFEPDIASGAGSSPEGEPAPPVINPEEVPPDASFIQPVTQSSAGANEAAVARHQFTEDIRPQFAGAGIRMPIAPSYSNFFPGGGKEGESNYNRAFKELPQEIADATTEGANLEGQLGAQQADHYSREKDRQSQEYKLIRERQLQNQNEVAAKQKQMEEATIRYTNDLADRGQFWRNPQNIVAAIGASLMHLGSDDPTISYRVISKAIENDWNHRKYLADRDHTGRSEQINLYRQLANDKELGDRLALLESNRVAAMELDRIGGQMRGPIAKARTRAVLGELQRNIAVQQQQLYAMMYYNKAAPTNPAMLAQLKKEGQAAPGVGPTPYQGAWEAAKGSPTASPQAAQAEKPDGQGAAVLGAIRNVSPGGKSFVDRAVDKHPIFAQKKEDPTYESRAPGSSDLTEMYKREIAMRSIRQLGPYATKHALDKKADEIIEQDWTEAQKVAKELQPHVGKIKGWSAFQTQLAAVESAARAAGEDPNSFLGYIRDATPGRWGQYIQGLRQKFSSRNDEHSKQVLRQLDASEKFHQTLSGKIVDFFHENGGTALSQTELDNLKQVIDHSSNWQQIRNFAEGKSQQMSNEMDGYLSQAGGGRSATMLRILLGQNNLKKIDSQGATGTKVSKQDLLNSARQNAPSILGGQTKFKE